MTGDAMEAGRALLFAAVVGAMAGCSQEHRAFRELPPGSSSDSGVPLSELHPGGVSSSESTTVSYGDNAYALAEGRKLYMRMNCVGCHFHGGGGIGPPLMDDEWIYGSDPSQIFKTIVEGRPNGMPTFKGKLDNQQVWQIVAFVRSLSGIEGSSVSSSREDHMYISPNLALRSEETPKGKTIKKP
jgi:cytochrome c oxidase cbb3-type subunit 3